MDQAGCETQDKLHAVVRLLASGTGTLKARLRAAFTPDLPGFRSLAFPSPELAGRWSAVMSELAPDDRSVITLEQWWDFELIRIAQEVVDIYDQLGRLR